MGGQLDGLTTNLDAIHELTDEVITKGYYSQEFHSFIKMECHWPRGKGVKGSIITL